MIKSIPLVIILAFGLLSCSEANFDNTEQVDSLDKKSPVAELDNSSLEPDKEGENQLAAEPVSVGGAFLTCAYEAKELVGVHQVGCDIRNEHDETLSNEGSATFSIVDGQTLSYILRPEPLPYLISVPAAQLLDTSGFITATLTGLDFAEITVQISIADLMNKPDMTTITGFQPYVALFATLPTLGQNGPLKLYNKTCLESSDVVFSGGTKVQFKPCNGEAANQMFAPILVAEDAFIISQNNQASCIDIPFEGGEYIPQLNLYNDCHMGINQQFKLVENEGFYSVASLTNPDFCLSYNGDADLILKSCF